MFGWETVRIPDIEISITHLGARLMHSFNEDGIDADELSGDIIVFCFGEIDVRCHVYKYKEKGFKNVIDELVNDYFAKIQTYTDGFKKVCVYFVPPPVKRGDTEENEAFPFLGTNKERQRYTLYMNKKLAEGCKERGFIFIDIYDAYCDKDGFLRKDMSDGTVHIKDTEPLEKFIINNLLKEIK